MNIKVNVKQIGAKRDRIRGEDFYIEGSPSTVGEFIAAAVKTSVEEYNRRLERGDAPAPIPEEDIRSQSGIGKIAFGINYSGKRADEKQAAENALAAYEDGLFRIFAGETEAGGINDKIDLSEGCSVTFVRLAMLSGRMW